MADGDITVKISGEAARLLMAAAAESGLTPDDYVSDMITDGLSSGDGRWAVAEAALEDFDRTGVSVDAETAMAEFRERVAARVAKG
jgi:hypothetical protein